MQQNFNPYEVQSSKNSTKLKLDKLIIDPNL